VLVGVDGRELEGRPTGAGRYLRSLLRAWSREGSDRFLVYTRDGAATDDVLRQPGIEERPLPAASPGALWQEMRLAPAAERDGVDVFFSPAYVCPLRLRRPRVTAVHDLSFFSYPQDFTWLDALRRRVLVSASVARSAAVLGCSEFTCRELRGTFPEAASRVHHVPLGPDEDLPPAPPRDEARRRLGLRGPLVLTVGSILNRRCMPELLHAFELLRARWPEARLEIVGDNRTHPRLDLARMRRELNLDGHVALSGFVTDAELAERYAAADVAVFLSEYEGFGLPALEAMARGVPVVVSDRPSLSEVFGEAAAVVPPRDPARVAAMLSAVLEQPARRLELVERGRALAARHSWQRTAALTRAALAEAAAP
jgi:glycosyltransferase involved in cell wall biosynthesis